MTTAGAARGLLRSAALFALSAVLAGPVPAGELAAFKDWVVGCDDADACTAIGLSGEDFGFGAYLVVRRDAGPEAAVVVTIVAPNEAGTGGEGSISLALDGTTTVDLAAEADDETVRGLVDPDDAAAVVEGIRNAATADVEVSLAGGGGRYAVSLAGSAAALLRIDDVQGRVGTVTALARPGPAAAETVPDAPPLAEVAAIALVERAEPGEPPAGIPAVVADDCPGPPPRVVFDLADGAELWGVCTSAGAYNVFYDFHLVRDGRVDPVRFPGNAEAPGTLVNPYATDDGLLAHFARSRGIGDCGEWAEFAFDGRAFVVVARAVMSECRGVAADDWPVLDRAAVVP